jgi:O-antigen/teichoic acid export membrane protein
MLKSLLKDSFLYGVADLISKGVAAIMFPIFTHYLTVEDFGVLSLITILSALATMLVECGINNAIQILYFESRFQGNRKPLVTTGILVQAIWGIAITTLFISIVFPFQNILSTRYQIRWNWFLLSMFIVVPNLLIRYCLNITRLHYKPLLFGIISLFSNLLWMFLAVYLMQKEWGISGYFVANLSLLLLILPFAIGSIKRDIGGGVSKGLAREIFKLGFPFIFSNVAFWLFGSIDRWMLAEFANTREVGLYSVAYKISIVVVMINSAFGQAWSPILFRELNKNRDQGIQYIDKVAHIYLSFLTVVCSGVILFSKEVLQVLTPVTYWGAYFSVGLIAFAIFFNGTTQFSLIGLSMAKKTKFINLSSWIAVIVNVLVNVFLSKYFGAAGASFAMLLTYVLLTGCYNLFSSKVYPYHLKLNLLIAPVIILSVLNIIVLTNQQDNFVFLLVKIGVFLSLCFYYLSQHKSRLRSVLKFFPR